MELISMSCVYMCASEFVWSSSTLSTTNYNTKSRKAVRKYCRCYYFSHNGAQGEILRVFKIHLSVRHNQVGVSHPFVSGWNISIVLLSFCQTMDEVNKPNNQKNIWQSKKTAQLITLFDMYHRVQSISPVQPPTFSHLIIKSHNFNMYPEIRCTNPG